MKIKWYGTASLLVEEGSTRILIDPYLKKYNKKVPALDVEEAVTASAVFITHPHFDHFSDIAEFTKGEVKKVYVSQNGIYQAQKNKIPTDKMQAVSAGDEITVGDITVRVFKSRHCRFDVPTVFSVLFNPLTYCHFIKGVKILRLTSKYRMKDDIFAFEISGGGKKIMALGSAGMDGDERYPQDADLFVFPYQGRSGMDKYIKPFLRVFRPKKVMIDHYDNAFPPITHLVNSKKFIPAVKEVLPEAEAFVPTENVWYEV